MQAGAGAGEVGVLTGAEEERWRDGGHTGGWRLYLPGATPEEGGGGAKGWVGRGFPPEGLKAA